MGVRVPPFAPITYGALPNGHLWTVLNFVPSRVQPRLKLLVLRQETKLSSFANLMAVGAPRECIPLLEVNRLLSR